MTTKNKIKPLFTKTQLYILENALDILMNDLYHYDPDFEGSVQATAKEKKYFKDIQKLYLSISTMASEVASSDKKRSKCIRT